MRVKYFRNFYHISRLDLGPVVKLKPKIPESSVICREGDIPRVCVAPSIYKCIKSIVSNKHPSVGDFLFELKENDEIKSPTIYHTTEVPFIPPRCSDFSKTDERWFLKKTTFNRLGYLDLNSFILGKISLAVEPIVFRLDHNCYRDINISNKIFSPF